MLNSELKRKVSIIRYSLFLILNLQRPQLPNGGLQGGGGGDDGVDGCAEGGFQFVDGAQVKGIGRWSAEVYLLFAEGRADVWPAGDLAVQVEVGRILGLEDRPTEKRVRELAEAWRPHRGAAAIFAWHHRHMEDALP